MSVPEYIEKEDEIVAANIQKEKEKKQNILTNKLKKTLLSILLSLNNIYKNT